MAGISVSPGVAFGKAFVYQPATFTVPQSRIDSGHIDAEIERFLFMRNKTAQQLEQIKAAACQSFGEEHGDIFDGHIMLLEDEELEEEIIAAIRNEQCCAEAAIDSAIQTQCHVFQSLEDEYLRERATDVRDIGDRLLKNLLGVESANLADINEPVILVAKDLTPSETAQINLEFVQGFITDLGGRTSHTSILARSLELPAIVGAQTITEQVSHGSAIILDALNTECIIAPSAEQQMVYQERAQQFQQQRQQLAQLRDLPAQTQDGHHIELCANIGSPAEIDSVLRNGCDGIGLFRSELLFMERSTLPSEEEQFAAYRTVVKAMDGKPVTIRTLDIGGDKAVPCLDLPAEENPFLGWRAIRICLDRRDLFRTQLRAIVRASIHGSVRLLFPMIISEEEIIEIKSELEAVKQQLRDEGIDFKLNIPIGIMIETPAAVAIAPQLAKHVDFFSIGTNDLTQYTLAVDRGNLNIAHLYNPTHPAVLWMIERIVQSGHDAGITVGMCGELAGDDSATEQLVRMGLDELSMSAQSVPVVKGRVRGMVFG